MITPTEFRGQIHNDFMKSHLKDQLIFYLGTPQLFGLVKIIYKSCFSHYLIFWPWQLVIPGKNKNYQCKSVLCSGLGVTGQMDGTGTDRQIQYDQAVHEQQNRNERKAIPRTAWPQPTCFKGILRTTWYPDIFYSTGNNRKANRFMLEL